VGFESSVMFVAFLEDKIAFITLRGGRVPPLPTHPLSSLSSF
jgi:hypothetical protein